MAINIGGITVDSFIMPPTVTEEWRSRSNKYTIDGTASEQRIGTAKKRIDITFGILPAEKWEQLKSVFRNIQFNISGGIGSVSVTGVYHVKENDIPTPFLFAESNGQYCCKPFSITLEEI